MEPKNKTCLICGRTEKENVSTDCIVEAHFNIETQRFKSGFSKPYHKSIDKSIFKQGINYLCSNRSNCNQRLYANRKQHRLSFPYENLKEEHALHIFENIIEAKFHHHNFIKLETDKLFFIIGNDKDDCANHYHIQFSHCGDIFINTPTDIPVTGLTYLKIYDYLQSKGYQKPKIK